MARPMTPYLTLPGLPLQAWDLENSGGDDIFDWGILPDGEGMNEAGNVPLNGNHDYFSHGIMSVFSFEGSRNDASDHPDIMRTSGISREDTANITDTATDDVMNDHTGISGYLPAMSNQMPPRHDQDMSDHVMQSFSNAFSNSMVRYGNGTAHAAHSAGMSSSLGWALDPEMQISGPMSSALLENTLVTQELARPVQGPKRPLIGRANDHHRKKNPRDGPTRRQADIPKRGNNRKGKKRPRQEQVARDKGACRQCKSAHKTVSCLPFKA